LVTFYKFGTVQGINKQQNKTKQNKTKQNKTKQNKTKQNKTKQNKTKQKTKNKKQKTKTKTKQKIKQKQTKQNKNKKGCKETYTSKPSLSNIFGWAEPEAIKNLSPVELKCSATIFK
jgi:hypothetical protein